MQRNRLKQESKKERVANNLDMNGTGKNVAKEDLGGREGKTVGRNGTAEKDGTEWCETIFERYETETRLKRLGNLNGQLC